MSAVRTHLRPLPRHDGRVVPLTARRPAARRRVNLGLWAPITPLAALLAPLALALVPFLEIPFSRYRPLRSALAIGALLFALSGTTIEVDTPAAHIRIRIF